MELEKSFLYTHLGNSVYSDIEKIDYAIDLIVESMIAYKDNELKKLRVTDVSICACGSTKYYMEQHKDVTKYYCSKCHEKIESKH